MKNCLASKSYDVFCAFKKFACLFGVVLVSLTGVSGAAADQKIEIKPFIHAEDDDVKDFSFSLYWMASELQGFKPGASDNWNIAFFSGKKLISDGRIVLDKLPIKDDILLKDLSTINSTSNKCIIQELTFIHANPIVVSISSYEETSSDGDKICFLLAVSQLIGLHDKIEIRNDLKFLISRLFEGIMKNGK